MPEFQYARGGYFLQQGRYLSLQKTETASRLIAVKLALPHDFGEEKRKVTSLEGALEFFIDATSRGLMPVYWCTALPLEGRTIKEGVDLAGVRALGCFRGEASLNILECGLQEELHAAAEGYHGSHVDDVTMATYLATGTLNIEKLGLHKELHPPRHIVFYRDNKQVAILVCPFGIAALHANDKRRNDIERLYAYLKTANLSIIPDMDDNDLNNPFVKMILQSEHR